MLQEKGPSNFAFSMAFRRSTLSLTAFNIINNAFNLIQKYLTKTRLMRFGNSHSFVSFNCVCTTVLFVFFKKLGDWVCGLDVLLEIRMFILKLQCFDFSFHKSRSWCRQMLLVLFGSVIHPVLFIILEIVLFACLIKERSFWWIFSCLFSLIGGLEEERSLTIFNRCQINTYIRANIFQKSKRCRFAVKLDQTTTNLWTFSALTPFNFLQLSLRVIP